MQATKSSPLSDSDTESINLQTCSLGEEGIDNLLATNINAIKFTTNRLEVLHYPSDTEEIIGDTIRANKYFLKKIVQTKNQIQYEIV